MLTQLGSTRSSAFTPTRPKRCEGRSSRCGSASPNPLRASRNVVVCSGHMIDAPDRPDPRFPRSSRMRSGRACAWSSRPRAWGRARSPSAAGRAGADIIFGELAVELGADLRMLLALPPVRDAGPVRQASRRRGRLGGAVPPLCSSAPRSRIQSDRLGDPARTGRLLRTNLWILDTARVEAAGRGNSLRSLSGSSSRPATDRRTSRFAEKAERMKRLIPGLPRTR